MCKTGPRKVAEAKALADKRAEEARLAAAKLRRAEDDRKAATDAEELRQTVFLQLLHSASSDLTKVFAICGALIFVSFL